MENGSVVKTEIKLSERDVQNVLAAEVAKVVSSDISIVEKVVQTILFSRKEKRYSSDPTPLTYFELAVQDAMKPLIKEQIEAELKKQLPAMRKVVRKVIKSDVIDTGEFEKRLIEALSEFWSDVQFYRPRK